jgi:hypothetical protein
MRWTEGESAAVRQFVGSDRALTNFLNQRFGTNRSLTNVRKHRQRLKLTKTGFVPWADYARKKEGYHWACKAGKKEIVMLSKDSVLTIGEEHPYSPELFEWGGYLGTAS